VETESFSWKLSGVEWARVREGAIGLTLDVTFVLPFGEITKSCQFCWILHPLDNLEHGDKVDIVSVNHLHDKFNELILETLV